MKQPVLFDVPITGHKTNKRRPASNLVNKVNHEKAKDRYYYHRRLKDVFPVDGANRVVDVSPYKSYQEIPVGPRYYVGKLIKLGYNIQLKIE